jgi:hypothetical protein
VKIIWKIFTEELTKSMTDMYLQHSNAAALTTENRQLFVETALTVIIICIYCSCNLATSGCV